MIRLPDIPGLASTRIAAPRVDPSTASAASRSLGDLGSSIAKIGGAFESIALDTAKAEQAAIISSKRSELRRGWAEKQLEIDNLPDPQERIRLADDYLAESRGVLDDPKLSPDGREELTKFHDSFADSAYIAVRAQAAQLTQDKARLSINQEFEEARTEAELIAAHETGVKAGIELPEALPARLQAFREKQQDEADYAEAQYEPNLFLEHQSEKPAPGEDPVRHQRLRQTALRALAQETAQTTDEIQDAIAAGKITTPEQIDALAGNLRPVAVEHLKTNLATRGDAKAIELQKSPAYQAATISKVTELLGIYDVETEGFDAAYVEMDSMVRGLPTGAVKTELSRRLKEAREGQIREIESNADIHRQALDDLLKSGGFGSDTKRRPIQEILNDGLLKDTAKLQSRGFDEDQAKKIAEEEDPWQQILTFRELSKKKEGFDYSDEYDAKAFDLIKAGTEGYLDYPDLASKQKRRLAYGQAKTKLEQWIKANPDAGEEQGRQQLLKILGDSAIPNAVDILLSQPPSLFDGEVLPPKPED